MKFLRCLWPCYILYPKSYKSYTSTSNLYPGRGGGGESQKKSVTVQMRDEEVLNQSNEEGEVNVQDILEQRELALGMANMITASPDYVDKENTSNS